MVHRRKVSRCSRGILSLFLCLFTLSAVSGHATVYYVKTNGNDANSGLTWALAKQHVQAGITATGGGGDQVWVAKGTYPQSF